MSHSSHMVGLHLECQYHWLASFPGSSRALCQILYSTRHKAGEEPGNEATTGLILRLLSIISLGNKTTEIGALSSQTNDTEGQEVANLFKGRKGSECSHGILTPCTLCCVSAGAHEPPKAAKERRTTRHVVRPHALRSYLIWKTSAVPHKRQFVFTLLRDGLVNTS